MSSRFAKITRLNCLFIIFLAFILTISIYAAGEDQEKVTDLNQAQITFDKTGKSPTMIRFDQAKQPTLTSFF